MVVAIFNRWHGGRGIDPEVLKEGRAGHYGSASMQEHGKGVGGKMAVWSEVGSDTEIELTIPASIAYAKSTVAHESTFLKKERDELEKR